MKNAKIALLTACAFTLTACPSKPHTPRPLGYEENTASFMLNYRRDTAELPSGSGADIDNLLYEQKIIQLGQKITAPSVDPIRIHYEFKGWFKETECINEWNFDSDVANSNVFLYAKWGQTSMETYEEPEYTYPETIIGNANFVVKGILNMPIENGKVKLTSGAIKRLENSPLDVNFAINYERKENISFSSTYDSVNKKIAITASTGETTEVTVVDNTAAKSIASISSTYEQKAQNYENNGKEYENYHVMLAGSSSMEMWESSKEDLAPIVSYNHGIGGTTVEQWTDLLLERLVLPYSPKVVIFYVGVNNIINSGEDGTTVGNKLKVLMDKVHEHLPNTRVFYVLINKLPGYPSYVEDFNTANTMIENYSKDKEWISCIDAGTVLLKENGEPNAAYFRTDGLHMSLYGYVLWGNEVRKALIDWLG